MTAVLKSQKHGEECQEKMQAETGGYVAVSQRIISHQKLDEAAKDSPQEPFGGREALLATPC